MQNTRKTNVVLIGSTGHGKSTFGNWIHDFGQAKPPLFVVGDTPDPCTQSVVLKQVQVCADGPVIASGHQKAVSLNLIDTPGLNEENVDNDVKHMSELLQVVYDLKHLSCVVLCIDFGFRRDSQVVATLQYYQKLFQPVFHAGNVIIVLTKVDSSTYSSQGWSQAIETRRAVISDILGFKVQSSNIFALSSCFPYRKLSKCINREKGTLTFPSKKNLLFASLVARLQFITLTSQLTPISMEGHLFPLPPCLEILRMSHIQVVNEKLKQLQITLYTENEQAGEYIQQEAELQAQIEQLTLQIDGVEKEIREKRQTQRTPSQVAHDNSIFLRGKIEPLKLESPLPDFDIEEQKYNCKYKKQEENPNGLVVVPLPDFFTFRSKGLPDDTSISARWYLRMQLAYSGETFFKADLERLDAEKIYLEVTKAQKEKHQKQVEDTHKRMRAGIQVHQTHRQDLDAQKALFIHTSFELSRIPALLQKLLS